MPGGPKMENDVYQIPIGGEWTLEDPLRVPSGV